MKLLQRLGSIIVVFGTACVAVTVAAIALAVPDEHAGMITENLYATRLIGSGETWVVGAFGAVWHSADGGSGWQKQSTGTTEPLFSVDFVDAKRGWVVGRSGIILHTVDGGEHWVRQQSNTDKHLFGVDFADDAVGCAVGDWGTIVRTRDGGATWESRSLPRDVILNSVFMLDRSLGWAAGEMGTVVMTQDGGETWVGLSSGVEKTLFDIDFTDARRGWAVGLDGLILHTEDGGRNWTVQHGSPEMGGLEQVGFVQAYDNPSLYAVAIAGQTGFAVGDIGAIFESDDGGETWARKEVPAEWGLRWFRGIALTPGMHGMIVGAEGWRAPIVQGHVKVPAVPAGAR